MKIEGIKSQNIINSYNNNKGIVINEDKKSNVTDTIEISELGKSLTNYSIEGSKVNRESKIELIKNKIDNGTYNVNANVTAKSILDNIRGTNL